MAERSSTFQESSGMTLRDLRKRRHSIDLIFVLMILAAFIIVGVLLIELGTGIYQKILGTFNDNTKQRTAVAYIRQKVRSAGSGTDEANVSVGILPVAATDELEISPASSEAAASEAGGPSKIQALVLHQEIGNEPYNMYLYVYDGSMRELLVREGNDQIPASAGTPIMDCKGMTLEQETNAILVTVDTGSEKVSFLLDH